MGDNINSQQVVITTVLYDNGDIYEGYCNVTVCGEISKEEMVWTKLSLPKAAL